MASRSASIWKGKGNPVVSRSHREIMGKNLLVLAAAALYIATVEHGLNIAKTMITDAAEVNTIPLRKRLTDILQDA